MSKRFRPRLGARGGALRCEPLEDRTVPAPLVGLTEDNRLVSFDSATPGTPSAPVPITNLQPSETILGIDYRPANNKLYALGSTSRLYTIDAATGKATEVGTGPFVVPLNGTDFGFDFNPAVDKLRVVSNTGQNLRLNADTGAVLDGDPATAGVQPDKTLNTGPINVVGAAYSNNFDRPLVTTLYGIDATADRLVAIGGLDGGPPAGSPNAGVTIAFGKLGFDTDGRVGFDIGINGKAFATLTAPGGTTSQLFTVDVSVIDPNGVAATPVGTIGFALRGVTAAPFLVTNTGDSGPGSLRQAILDANASSGTDVIAFAIGTGPQTIAPLSALPDITEATVLD
ncbi:MAG TPA: DUF4394 domain-containing protein, partial [Fimbriiglobus sp.]|nr:DUF4394 domain-containing protein [Fimbriiglobus sp.]